MSAGMDCAAARTLLPLLLDGELQGAERAALEAHIASCAGCRAAWEALAAESRRVRALAGAYEPSAALRPRIMSALDAADRAEADRMPPPRRTRALSPALAIAAALVLLLVGAVAGYLVAQEPVEQRLSADVTSAHLRVQFGDKLVDVASSDRHTVKPWFNGRVDHAPPVEDLTEEGFRLVGGRVDYVGERRVAVLVYRHRQHAIDLYAWPESTPRAPAAATRRGYNLRSWSQDGMAFWAISDLNAADLDRFVARARARLRPSER
jgi:anti-sigma factor RsiW